MKIQKAKCIFKKRNIIFYSFILSAVLLLTGCGDLPKAVTEYNIGTAGQSVDFSVDTTASQAKLFSEGLCVIPKDTKFEQDSTMTCVSSLLVDDTEGTVLYSDKLYKKMYPASITKIITALVTLKYGNLDDMVTVSYDASHITEWGATLCGLNEGDQIDLRSLLTCFLMYSGNDAGVAIAEHVGGSVEAFADMMNQEMKLLGASGSHFVNPHGLHDKDHYTTAYDLYLVFHELTNYETFLDIIQTKEFKAVYRDKDGKKVKKKFSTTNRYLNGKTTSPEGITVLGGKTGTTSKAGSCLILYSEKENGHRYISIVLKAVSADDLFYQMTHLLEMAASK